MKTSDRILEKKKDSVTFVVDRNLPPPDGHLECPKKGQVVAESILRKRNISGEFSEIFAMSCPDILLYSYGQDVFFQTLVKAFAEHRPVVISPDVIWLLICQGFSQHINQDPELCRERLVNHKGKKELVVEFHGTDLPTPEDWKNIIVDFSKQVEDNTKDSIASTLVTDFSTTDVAEGIATRITLLDTVKPFFEYVVHHFICGIPFITLKGTPEDWETMIDKVRQLAKYDLDWWIADLIPILQEFVETAKGKPRVKFWKSIVKSWRPREMRGSGCGSWGPPSSTVNGWILKFFPYNRDGRTPEKVNFDETMFPETVSVPFIYKLFDNMGKIITEIPMEITAGIIGIEENPDTYALTPKIAWFVSRSESEEEMLKGLKEMNKMREINMIIQEVPSALRLLKHINYLALHFIGKVDIPDWLDKVKIERLIIYGEMTPSQKKDILRRFPKCIIGEEE